MQRVGVVKDGVRIMMLKTFKLDSLVGTTTIRYVPGNDFMLFATVLPDGRTESHVAAMGVDGRAVLSPRITRVRNTDTPTRNAKERRMV